MSALSSLMNNQTTAESTSSKRLYKSTTKFCNIITPKGKMLHFRGGMFITDNPDDIAYLDAEIESGSFAGSIFIDPNARTISDEEANPMLALKKQFYALFLAEQAAHTNPGNDMGTSAPGKLNAASTSDIAPVALGGVSGTRVVIPAKS